MFFGRRYIHFVWPPYLVNDIIGKHLLIKLSSPRPDLISVISEPPYTSLRLHILKKCGCCVAYILSRRLLLWYELLASFIIDICAIIGLLNGYVPGFMTFHPVSLISCRYLVARHALKCFFLYISHYQPHVGAQLKCRHTPQRDTQASEMQLISIPYVRARTSSLLVSYYCFNMSFAAVNFISAKGRHMDVITRCIRPSLRNL